MWARHHRPFDFLPVRSISSGSFSPIVTHYASLPQAQLLGAIFLPQWTPPPFRHPCRRFDCSRATPRLPSTPPPAPIDASPSLDTERTRYFHLSLPRGHRPRPFLCSVSTASTHREPPQAHHCSVLRRGCLSERF